MSAPEEGEPGVEQDPDAPAEEDEENNKPNSGSEQASGGGNVFGNSGTEDEGGALDTFGGGLNEDDEEGDEEEENADNNGQPPAPQFEELPEGWGSQLAKVPYWRLWWNRSTNYRREEEEAEEYVVTRADMMTYLNTQLWFNEAAYGIPFTIALWVNFLVLLGMHASIESNYQVQSAVGGALVSVVAYPELGNTPAAAAGDTSGSACPTTCHCACVPRADFTQPEACQVNALNRNYLNVKSVTDGQFFPEYSGDQLRSQMYKQKTDNMAFQDPVPYDSVDNIDSLWFWIQHGAFPFVWNENDFAAIQLSLQQVTVTETTTTTTTTTTDPSLAGNETNAETTAPSTGPVIVAPVAIAKRPGRLYVTNQLIGGIRLRQKRLKTTSDCDVNPELQEFYNADCRTGDEETSNWKGVSHRCFEPVKDQTDGYFDCLFDVGRPLASTAGPLEDIEYTLRPFQWLDGATEEVQFQGAFFNAEVRLYSLLTLTFTFENGGYMEKRMKVAAISANMYPTFWYIVPDLIFLAMISQLLYQEGFEVINAKRSGLLSFYLSDFWNLVDWLSIIAGFVISFLWFNIVLRTQSVGDLIADLGPTPETAATSALYQSKWTRIVDDLSSLSDSQDVQFMFLYWYTLVLMLRFFKNFQGQPRLSQISSTLLKSLLDMGHFLIVFAVVFVNFAIGGNLMFGTSSDDWSSIMGAINTSMMALLGNIDMDALMEVSPITAYLWFWSFMVINWYILMNLLVAIVFDHYYSFRDTVGETQGLGSQIADVFFEKSWAIDWYLQRKQYLKKEVIDPMPEYKVFRFFHPKKFGYLFLDEQMSYEEVYEAMVEESPQGEVYGRPTILEQRTEKRNADRAAFEESLRHESKDGGNRLSMLEAEQMAKKRSSSGEAPSSKGGSKEPLSNTGGSGVVVPRSASKNAEPAVSVPAEGTHAMEPPPWWSDGSSSSGSRSPLPSATGPECFTTSRTTFHNQQRGGSASSSSPRTDDEHDSSGGIEMTNFSMRENREREAFSTLRARLARTSSSVSSTTQERHRENKIRAALGGRSSRKLRRYLLQEGAHRMAEGEDEEIEKAERTGEDAVINPDDMMIPDGEKTKQSGGDVDEPPVADENDARPDGKTSPASGANQSPASKDPASQPPGAEGGGGEEGDDAEDGEQQISRQSSKSGSGSKKKLLAKGTMQIQKEQMAYIREPITFEDLEALGVEPRFARHLMLRCHRFVLAETGYEERRKQELTSLAIETGKMLQHVDHDCSGLQKQLAIILDSVVKSCKDLEETIDDTHMSLAKLEKERGVAPCQGTPLSAGHYRETPWNKGQHVTTVPGVRENNMTQARNTLAIMAGSPSASGGASPFGGTGASKFKALLGPKK